MTNDANRMLLVLVGAALIVLMALAIFLTWSADTDVIDRIGDLSEYLDKHNDGAGKLIVTLGALVVAVLALLLVIVELAPEDEERELRLKQGGAVTIVPAIALRQRLEEALLSHPQITAAQARVSTADKGIAASLSVTIVPSTNVATLSQDAVRIVVDTIQTDLGLPVHGVPSVRVTFGGPKPQAVASSVYRAPEPEPAAPPPVVAEEGAAREDEVTPGASPGPMVYEPSVDDAAAPASATEEGEPPPTRPGEPPPLQP